MTKALLGRAASCLLAVTCWGCGSAESKVSGSSPSVTMTTTANVGDVAPAEVLPVTVAVANVTLVDPTQTPPPEPAAAGYLEFHFDDEASVALLVTAQTDVTVKIPAAATPGPHRI